MGRLQSKKASGAHQREETLAQVMLGCLPPVTGPVLVVDDRGPLGAMLSKTHDDVEVWSRFVREGVNARAWPEGGPWSQVLIRLPKGRTSLEMAAHAACGALSDDGACFVYGANDEGIRSTGKKLSAWFDDVRTIQTQRKCRVVMASQPKVGVFQSSLADWMSASTLTLDQREVDWVTWPGLFAKGALDDATALLLSCLSDALSVNHPSSAMDYGCGTGILARFLLDRDVPTVHALDADAVALEATAHNAPATTRWLSSRLSDLPESMRWDWVVSNPPFHEGKHEDFGVMRQLIVDAAARANTLWMVTQRQIPCGPLLEEVFDHVERVRTTTRFSVWRATQQ